MSGLPIFKSNAFVQFASQAHHPQAKTCLQEPRDVCERATGMGLTLSRDNTGLKPVTLNST
jgi:hypothetical protein